MNIVQLITTLANHIERFDCYVDKGRLKIIGRSRAVGMVDGERMGSWGNVRIKSLNEDAYPPDYLRPLVGRQFETREDLLRAIRKVAFLNEVQEQFGRDFRDAINELASIKPPGREP